MKYESEDLVTVLRYEDVDGLELVWSVQPMDKPEGPGQLLILRVDAESKGDRKHCSAMIPHPFDATRQLDDPRFRVDYMLPMKRAVLSHFIGDAVAKDMISAEFQAIRAVTG